MTVHDAPYRRRAAIFGIAATTIYCAMIFGSLARLEAQSGLVPFDMRPMGYSLDDAQALLHALEDSGRAYYTRVQLALDTAYPALLALTLVNLFRWVGRDVAPQNAVKLGVVLSWMAALLDYAENACIAAMLVSWDTLPEPLVVAASTATLTKSLATSAAIACLMGLVGWRIWRKTLQRRALT